MEKTSGWTKGNSSALVLAALCTMTVCGAAAVDPAEWITGSYVVPGEDDYAAHFADAPAPVLKREFTLVAKPVKRATWRIAAPGMYDASVNGKRVNAVALPVWTAFDRRVLEDEYDVAALVKGGANTLTLELGNGWWNPLPMKMWGRYNLRKTLPHGTPAAKATLEVEYADGTSEHIVTDGAWLAAEGPVLRNNLYLGEKRDARRTVSEWKAARIAKDPPKGAVLPRGETPPVTVYDRWKAKSVSALPGGRWLVDMGVNFAGTIRATLKGTHDGDVVTFRYGELKYPDGTVNVMTAVCGQQKRSAANPPGLAEQKDTVICPAAESFVYEPRFTFHGFRYVEVAGLREAPSPEDFEALAWSADVKDSASFECSDPKINRLRDICRRTFRSNLQGVQSDCPARERFGYGGDLAASAESFILNYDMAAFYRKVVRDRCDMEALHGVFTSTSPVVFPESGMQGVKEGKGDLRFGWAVDAPIVVDLLLRYYGDMETVREAYPFLRRFLVNCAEAFDVNHVPPCIGDHEALEKADPVTTAQCHYHQFLKLTAKFARLLGETADAARFEATAKELEAVFAAAARYVPAKGFVGNGRQGEECFAIYHKMLPPDDLDAAYGILRENVVGHEYALSTGIFSTQYLLEVLLARGDAEIAGKVLAHKGFPGWFNMLDNGATTLWETWAPSDNTYSQNHPMFGSCAAWLMRGILGIKVAEDAVGCDKVIIEPHAVAGVTWAKGHLDTPKGRISVSWRLENGQLKVEKTLPPGVVESAPDAAPVYEARNADVSADAVRCRRAGTPAIEGDAFVRRDFWTLANYDNRLGMEVGGVRDGVTGLCLDGSAKTCDTAWSATSVKVPLKGAGRRYRLGFAIDTTIGISLPNSDGESWRSMIFWHDADGKEMAKAPIAYSVQKGQRTEVAVYGDIPEGAVAFSLRLGFDWPNIGPANRIVFSGLSFEELADSPSYAHEATFTSEVRDGGKVSWRADVPGGCAVLFQWRGAPSLGELAKKPFVGPDVTGGTFFNAPFNADAPVIQYRVLLRSNGRATPSLVEVKVGGRTDRGWTLKGDVRPPRVRRTSPSPTRNPAETLRIEVKDATSTVMWDSLKVSVDGADRTAAFTRKDDVISLAAPSGGWAQGLHTAEVCAVDFHGNKAKSKKMFYVGDAPATPKVTLRDDGMTLVGGKPFFPIGLYAVCKRPFNGNSYDTAFKGLKDGGFNMAHTYGNPYDADFLAAAEKYGIKLWVEARFPDGRLIDIGRHNPNIIAWYLGDDTSDHILPELEADYNEAVKAVDPTRLTVQADPILSSSGGLSRYADYVTATDGLLPEIYPVRNAEGDSTDKTCVAVTIRDMKQFHEDVRLHGDGKPRTCWAIIQYFKGWSGWLHFPTREQLFATTFAAVIHGAHGVTWYTYGGFDKNEGVTSTPERWKNICDLATRLSALSPVLVERTPAQPPTPVILSGPKTDPLGGPSVTCLLKRHAGWNYLFAVNAAPEPVSAALAAEGAEKAGVFCEDRTCAATDGRITDDFAPFAVHIYRWRQPGN